MKVTNNNIKTSFDQIVNLDLVGKPQNHMKLPQLLDYAQQETMPPSWEDEEKVSVVVIDPLKDFMEGGALPVPGAIEDMKRFSVWGYENLHKITEFRVACDVHTPMQIFFPLWWMDKNGKHPEPYTVIKLADIDAGKWRATRDSQLSRDYVQGLEALGRYNLMIWPYHCLQGTEGATLESQFANLLYFHSVARRRQPIYTSKGTYPWAEMYGCKHVEFDPTGKAGVNADIFDGLEFAKKIVFVGQAKSHCVRASIEQFLDHFEEIDPTISRRTYILEDCMSNIPGFESISDDTYTAWAETKGLNLVKSTDFAL